MRYIKQIMITMALSALVIVASISFSNTSQAFAKYSVKAKHKHAVHKHGVKQQNISSKTLTKPEEERSAVAANDPVWFRRHMDPATGTIPTGLSASWYKSDQEHALARDGRDDIFSTGDPLDTVACLGPFRQGGRTRALLVSAADPNNNTFFAGGVNGGLWKSTNAGSNWAPVNDTAASLGVTCITQNPLNPDTIYYGTGEYIGNAGLYGGGDFLPGGGVFKSTDGGTTFQQLSATSNINFSWAIEHDKADANTVYWGTVDSGLQRTTNGGTTWGKATGTNGTVCDIVTFPNGSVLIAKTDSGLYSATVGKTGSFTKIASTAFPSSKARIRLAQCKNFPNVVYAAFAKDHTWGDGLSALCKSTDGGMTWDTVLNPCNSGFFLGGTQGNYNMMLGVNPLNSDSIICGLQAAFVSTDGGTTWAHIGVNGGDFHAYAPFNSGSSYFLCGCDHGITLCKWDSLQQQNGQINADTNYVTTQFVGGGFAGSGRRCIGGTQDNGSWLLSPTDTEQNLYDADAAYSYISQLDSNQGYIETADPASLTKYTNLFTSNYRVGVEQITPPYGAQGTNFYNFYQCDYADPLQLYYRTSAGIWRTTDTGFSWTQLNTTSIAGIDYIGCTSVSNPSVYFTSYVSPNAHFYRISAAKTFTPGAPTDLSSSIPTAVKTASFGEIASLPGLSTATTLYMCTTNYASIPHIYKVKNANTATPIWENLTGDLPSKIGVNEVQADASDTNVLFAATDYGLYYSTNNGTHWIKEPRVPNTLIWEMQLRASDNKLFVFTYGRGVWYCSIKAGLTGSVEQASVAPTPSMPQLQFSLYPNPATEKLTVSPQQTLSSSARIAIYSSDGRMISESAWNPTGEVNIGSLPSGAYFLQITDGNLVAKNKFIKQ